MSASRIGLCLLFVSVLNAKKNSSPMTERTPGSTESDASSVRISKEADDANGPTSSNDNRGKCVNVRRPQ